MKNHLLLCLLALCIVSLLLQSCDKEPLTRQLDEVHYELRHEDTIKVPYLGYDTLRFQRSDSTGIIDTLIFIGGGKRYYREEEYKMEECEGCYRWYYHDAFEIKFRDDSSRVIVLKFVSHDQNAYFSISYIGKFFYLSTWHFGHPVFGIDKYVIEINGDYYYNIVPYKSSKDQIYNDVSESWLFYNIQNGILRVELDNNAEIYELIE